MNISDTTEAPLCIRPVCCADAAAIAAILNHYILHTTTSFEKDEVTEEEMWQRISAIAGDYPYLVMEQDGEVLGYCYTHAWRGYEAYRHSVETTIYLAPWARRNGCGRALMEELIRRSRAAGVHALIACITAENEASCAFHEALGFRKVSHFRQVGRKFDRWLDVVDYELVLEP